MPESRPLVASERQSGSVSDICLSGEASNAFSIADTRVAACTLALSPIRDTLTEGFSHFVSSMTAPVASGWSGRRVGLAPTGKRRLSTAHTLSGHWSLLIAEPG